MPRYKIIYEVYNMGEFLGEFVFVADADKYEDAAQQLYAKVPDGLIHICDFKLTSYRGR